MSIAVARTPPAGVAHGPIGPIRVMVVDDSVVDRGMTKRWLAAEPDMQVVASVRDGREAIEQIASVNPDVVILDVTMPDIDGITALPLLLAKKPDLVVLMASTLTRRNAEITLRALALGAADYLPKPESNREFATVESFRRELIDKIRALDPRRKRGPIRTRIIPPPAVPATPARAGLPRGGAVPDPPGMAATELEPIIRLRLPSPTPPRVLLIGSSTGGPQALNALIGGIGAVIDHAPVLVTQHMPPTFTAILSEHLTRASGRPVREAEDGDAVRAGTVYLARGGRHMRVVRHDGEPVIVLDDDPPINFSKPAVDPMFCSAAAVWGPATLALVLTGMGSDGSRGAAEIVAAGGGVIVQDEASSVVWGMPGSVALAGLACAVLPLDQIGLKLIREFAGDRT